MPVYGKVGAVWQGKRGLPYLCHRVAEAVLNPATAWQRVPNFCHRVAEALRIPAIAWQANVTETGFKIAYGMLPEKVMPDDEMEEEDLNPYRAPQARGPRPISDPTLLPAFAKGWIIAALAFSIYRFGHSFIAFPDFKSDDLYYHFLSAELYTALGIVCCGIPTTILLLRRKPFGVQLAWVTVGLMVLNMVADIASLLLMPRGGLVAIQISTAVAFAVRLVILLFFVKAIKMARKAIWHKQAADAAEFTAD